MAGMARAEAPVRESTAPVTREIAMWVGGLAALDDAGQLWFREGGFVPVPNSEYDAWSFAGDWKRATESGPWDSILGVNNGGLALKSDGSLWAQGDAVRKYFQASPATAGESGGALLTRVLEGREWSEMYAYSWGRQPVLRSQSGDWLLLNNYGPRKHLDLRGDYASCRQLDQGWMSGFVALSEDGRLLHTGRGGRFTIQPSSKEFMAPLNDRTDWVWIQSGFGFTADGLLWKWEMDSAKSHLNPVRPKFRPRPIADLGGTP